MHARKKNVVPCGIELILIFMTSCVCGLNVKTRNAMPCVPL